MRGETNIKVINYIRPKYSSVLPSVNASFIVKLGDIIRSILSLYRSWMMRKTKSRLQTVLVGET